MTKSKIAFDFSKNNIEIIYEHLFSVNVQNNFRNPFKTENRLHPHHHLRAYKSNCLKLLYIYIYSKVNSVHKGFGVRDWNIYLMTFLCMIYIPYQALKRLEFIKSSIILQKSHKILINIPRSKLRIHTFLHSPLDTTAFPKWACREDWYAIKFSESWYNCSISHIQTLM